MSKMVANKGSADTNGIESEMQESQETPVSDVDRSHWVPDEDVTNCSKCEIPFSFSKRKHHCRLCGKIFCNTCSFHRALCEKSPTTPGRLCLECLMLVAKQTVGNFEIPANQQTSVVVPMNSSNEFNNIALKSANGKPAISAELNACFTIDHSTVEHLKKDTNGEVVIRNSVIFASNSSDVAIDVGGNSRLELVNCIVIGKRVAIHLHENAQMEASKCFIIATGNSATEDSSKKNFEATALLMENNSQSFCVNCVITGMDGVKGYHNSMIKAANCVIAGEAIKDSSVWNAHSAIAGAHMLDKDTKTVGKLSASTIEGPFSKLKKMVLS